MRDMLDIRHDAATGATPRLRCGEQAQQLSRAVRALAALNCRRSDSRAAADRLHARVQLPELYKAVQCGMGCEMAVTQMSCGSLEMKNLTSMLS